MAYKPEEIEKIFDKICIEISENQKSLRDVLKMKGTPSNETFYKWLSTNKDKSKRYARACEARADLIFNEMLEIADDGTNDYMINKNGDEVLNSEHVQRSRLRIDARKWMLSKMNPKKYGDKLDVTSGDKEIKERPVFVSINKDI